MNNMYIIPANSKSGKLLFNIFRPVDLAIFLTGVALSLILFLVIPDNGLFVTVLKILPISIGAFLVVPVAFYHNVLCLLKDIMEFLNTRRIYYWKGWCVKDEFTEDRK